MNQDKKTLVLGASTNPSRYSFLAINQLRKNGYPVVAVGNKVGNVLDVPIEIGTPNLEDIHTVTLYLSDKNQAEYIDYILKLKPKRIIFNPGAENETLTQLAEEAGIQTLEACTLVMLSTKQF